MAWHSPHDCLHRHAVTRPLVLLTRRRELGRDLDSLPLLLAVLLVRLLATRNDPKVKETAGDVEEDCTCSAREVQKDTLEIWMNQLECPLQILSNKIACYKPRTWWPSNEWTNQKTWYKPSASLGINQIQRLLLTLRMWIRITMRMQTYKYFAWWHSIVWTNLEDQLEIFSTRMDQWV